MVRVKILTQKLLEMTNFEHSRVSDLHLDVRPMESDTMEVGALDHELAVHHTSVDDVAMRKSPRWQEMVSVKNIRKIMNDRVLFGKYAGNEIKLDGVEHLIMKEDDILGIIEK